MPSSPPFSTGVQMSIIRFYGVIINQTDNQHKCDTRRDGPNVTLAPGPVYCKTPEKL